MSENRMRIETAHGVPFAVRIVRQGDGYGLGHKLVHDGDEPMVEFYDARFDDARFDEGLGQFVSRYDVGTIFGTDGWSANARGPGRGLMLQGGVPEWRVDGPAMDRVVEWLEEELGMGSAPSGP